ncbi:hypothetical protein HDU84_005065 [Entophlyctis sp. JEL0112]|nr:hypothetical protein HDU84_005065 [Entophlyctis sp. JEL0112]
MKPYTSDSGDAQRILTIETRGLDYISWQPTNKQTWVAEGAESGTVFDDIEFEDGETDWAGYDEKGGCPVEVLGIQGILRENLVRSSEANSYYSVTTDD